MAYYLLKYEDNWADEMDVEGHVILTEKEYQAFQESLEDKDYFTFSVGSNEEIEYETIDDLKNRIDVDEISQEEYEVFKKFGLLSAGFAPRLLRQLAW